MGKTGKKLSSNYNLSKWLIFTAFVVSTVFAEWHKNSTIIKAINYTDMLCNPYWLYTAIVGVVSGVALLGVYYLLVNGMLFFGRFYQMPKMEVYLLLLIALCGRNILFGLLNLTYLISPLVIPWGNYLFGIISGLPAMLWFYAQLKKRYLSVHSAGYVFAWIMFTFLLVNAVFITSGGIAI